MKRASALHCAGITVLLGCFQLAHAESFETSVQATGEHENGDEACALAFDLAEQQAMSALGDYFSPPKPTNFTSKLISENETPTQNDGKTQCVFEGTWRGEVTAQSSSSAANNLLIGSEQFIDGKYTGSCLDTSNGDLCWQRIVRQAEDDLFAKLSREGRAVSNISLRYLDFEGRQRDQYQQKRLEMTADGRFFFRVVERLAQNDDTYISITRSNSQSNRRPSEPKPAPVEKPIKSEPKKEKDNLDLTIFYTWDGNESALQNDLAISSNRWGIGLWANNRVGFAAFKGSDRLGIADENQRVINDSGSYETTGIGMGFRLWNTRAITLENMLYYVDAQPYRTIVAPDCDTCDSQTFRSDDYLQATVNIKTNSHGVNVGWMFTWKILESQPSMDTLSSGFYVELQF